MPEWLKKPAILCLLITVVALIGIVLGVWLKLPLITLFSLVPAAIYEAIRTEGTKTKAAAIAITVLLLADIGLVIGKVNKNMVGYVLKTKNFVTKHSNNIEHVRNLKRMDQMTNRMAPGYGSNNRTKQVENLMGKYRVSWRHFADIKVFFAGIIVLLSIFLVAKTWGVYTRWLAGILFVTSFASVYAMMPIYFDRLFKQLGIM